MTRRPANPVIALAALLALAPAPAAPPRPVAPGPNGRLVYAADARGNRVPDFSHCGYGGGGVVIPDVPARVSVPAAPGDATARIQAAIDHVAALPADERGLRGAVLLGAGRFEVGGCLRIAASGVVLRGQGPGPDGTVLVATGTDRRTLIQVMGRNDRSTAEAVAIADAYVPVGATKLRLRRAAGLNVGDRVTVEHPGTARWVATLKMDSFSGKEGGWLSWRPQAMTVRWERTVTAVDGDAITLDAPLTLALDASQTECRVAATSWPGRLRQVGVERLRCVSAVDPANPHDEEHAWMAVALDAVEDAWVRELAAERFVSSAVAVGDGARRVTVTDCQSREPVSEAAAYRRHAFFTSGQQTLFLRCRSERGRHDFAVGHLAAGPIAFVESAAFDASSFSGPVESWASGVLYDNVTIDGGGLMLTNREIAGQGVGWAAANSMLWQCAAPVVTCRAPPTAQNWAVGCWGQFVGDGQFDQCNEFVKPDSLYRAQLAERLGQVSPLPRFGGEGPGVRGSDILKGRNPLTPIPSPPKRGRGGKEETAATPLTRLALTDGRLVCEDKILAGSRLTPVWWRGSVVPGRLAEFGPAVTRFVPGRSGLGATDDLDELTDALAASGRRVLEHHWGLWYDRRRDDHQMVRRIDGEVWPPFYEQPWARSGVGTAWDGLSKYDLTKFNPWYFGRLKGFADRADRKGLVLLHQMYFQHNILEAGAHWADFPWRPANCLQATGFPEPPPYVGGKRIFMAAAFYDVTHPKRRELHRAYIRQCLATFADNANVIHLTGAEYTGPLAFVQFWLDTIREWQAETGKRPLVGLSVTKDVQDAVLADPSRAAVVNVIDLRSWWTTADGRLYAPAGGQDLAPRQHARLWKGSLKSADLPTAAAVRELRRRFPDKAVIGSLPSPHGAAVLAAGGSLPDLPGADAALLTAAARMRPVDMPERQFVLADPGRDYLVYAAGGERVRLDLADGHGPFTAYRIDPQTGRRAPAGEPVSGGRAVELTAPGAGPWMLWLTRTP